MTDLLTSDERFTTDLRSQVTVDEWRTLHAMLARAHKRFHDVGYPMREAGLRLPMPERDAGTLWTHGTRYIRCGDDIADIMFTT